MVKKMAKKSKTKRRYGRKKPRSTRKRRGGDKKVQVAVYESPTRPLLPVAKILITDKNKKGSVYQFEEYMSSLGYNIEDWLSAIYQNSKGKKLPKKIYIHDGFDIIEPLYRASV